MKVYNAILNLNMSVCELFYVRRNIYWNSL